LISVYCSGRFAFTFCTTAFAVSHNPHGLRVKKVMRQSRRRDVARNMTEIALTRAMDGGVAVVWVEMIRFPHLRWVRKRKAAYR
jgi:hypothetical protein